MNVTYTAKGDNVLVKLSDGSTKEVKNVDNIRDILLLENDIEYAKEIENLYFNREKLLTDLINVEYSNDFVKYFIGGVSTFAIAFLICNQNTRAMGSILALGTGTAILLNKNQFSQIHEYKEERKFTRERIKNFKLYNTVMNNCLELEKNKSKEVSDNYEYRGDLRKLFISHPFTAQIYTDKHDEVMRQFNCNGKVELEYTDKFANNVITKMAAEEINKKMIIKRK